MIYNITVNSSGVWKEILVASKTEIEAISEAVIRSKCNGLLPTKDEPGGEFYLDWLEEMKECIDAKDLKKNLFDQRILIKVKKGLMEKDTEKDHICEYMENGHCKICGESYNGH